MLATNEDRNTKSPLGNIALVGLMGAGKTSVGRLLARRLGKTFFDCDYEIERSTGVKVATIFEIEGESGFRARESRMLEELLKRNNILLATGGGAVLSEANCDLLTSSALVVYLRASARLLLRRTRHDRNRPLLQVADPHAKLEALLAERDPLYRQIADVIVDTGNQSLGTLATHIENCLFRLNNKEDVTQTAADGSQQTT
jgi:shikimate kinase